MLDALAYSSGCALLDAYFKRIPNILHITYLTKIILNQGVEEIIGILLRAMVIMIIMYMVYSLGILGGGDIKMIAVIVSIRAFEGIYIVLLGFCLAGVYSIILMLRNRELLKRFRYIYSFIQGKIIFKDKGALEISSQAQVRLGIFLGVGYIVWEIFNI